MERKSQSVDHSRSVDRRVQRVAGRIVQRRA